MMEAQSLDFTQVRRLTVRPATYRKFVALPGFSEANPLSTGLFPNLGMLTGIQVLVHELVPPGWMIAELADGRHIPVRIADGEETAAEERQP